MTKLAAVLCLFLAACATQKYHEEASSEPKTWNIVVKHVNKEQMKNVVTARGQAVCGQEPFRVVSCEEKLKGPEGFFNAVCKVKCGEKPFLAKEKSLDKSAAAKLKKEADESPEIQ